MGGIKSKAQAKTPGSRLTERHDDGATNNDRQKAKAKTSGSRVTPPRDDGAIDRADSYMLIRT